jgi:flagella basal body P-ring formation protein FlgA
MLARRAISPNQVIGVDDVESPPAVRRGDPVTIVIRTERLVVTCPGTARQDGRIGEMVPVLNDMTHRELRGRLRENGEVQIDYRPAARILTADRP